MKPAAELFLSLFCLCALAQAQAVDDTLLNRTALASNGSAQYSENSLAPANNRAAESIRLDAAESPNTTSNTQANSTDSYDKIWGYAKLFEAPENTFFKSFALSGRLQHDYANFGGSQGSFSDDLWRRFRFGFKSQLSDEWLVHIEADIDLNQGIDTSESYRRLTDANLVWSPKGRNWKVKLLKQGAGFTLDGATSSKKLLTLQRNNLSNNLWFTSEYYSGASITGKTKDGLWYRFGGYSTDGHDDIGMSEGSYFALASASYDFANTFEVDKAIIRADYVYNDKHEMASTRDFSRVVSISSQWQQGRWGLSTDLALGKGYDDEISAQSDVWGAVAMPYYKVSNTVELVARYTYVEGSGERSVRFGRYEREIADGRGNQYSEGYAGINVYIYGHKLKWQSGLQYADMRDKTNSGGNYHGWGLTTGLKLYW